MGIGALIGEVSGAVKQELRELSLLAFTAGTMWGSGSVYWGRCSTNLTLGFSGFTAGPY